MFTGVDFKKGNFNLDSIREGEAFIEAVCVFVFVFVFVCVC